MGDGPHGVSETNPIDESGHKLREEVHENYIIVEWTDPRLAKIERKWRWGEFRGFKQRGLPIPDPAEHADIVNAFAAGLAGNMEVVEAFIGLWELAH
jgi:hypothetical protein